jgi:hypothetical protein
MNPANTTTANTITGRGRLDDDLADDLADDDLADDDLADDDLDNDLDDDDLDDDLARALGLVEDWLLHASPQTLQELAEFAYGPPAGDGEHDHHRLRPIIDLLGQAAIRLAPTRHDAPAGQAMMVNGPSR